MSIINLTQHPATPEQIAAGVHDLEGTALKFALKLLTFDTVPTAALLRTRAVLLAGIAGTEGTYGSHDFAMIGGAPYLMPYLERALLAEGLIPLYAFSTRDSVESLAPDGSVTKTAIFRHAGFVEVPVPDRAGWTSIDTSVEE